MRCGIKDSELFGLSTVIETPSSSMLWQVSGKRINKINGLKDANGVWQESDEAI